MENLQSAMECFKEITAKLKQKTNSVVNDKANWKCQGAQTMNLGDIKSKVSIVDLAKYLGI